MLIVLTHYVREPLFSSDFDKNLQGSLLYSGRRKNGYPFFDGSGGGGGDYTPQKHPSLTSPYIHLSFKKK